MGANRNQVEKKISLESLTFILPTTPYPSFPPGPDFLGMATALPFTIQFPAILKLTR